jgi:hemerythrin-like metal-binding protein
MKTIEWSQAYEVGIVDIDVDHRRLFASFNNFAESIDKSVGTEDDLLFIQKQFSELAESIKKHFAFEEATLKQMNCTSYKEHHETHKRLLVELEGYKDTMRGASQNPKFSLKKFGKTIRQWMLDHIAEDGEDFKKHSSSVIIQSNSAV